VIARSLLDQSPAGELKIFYSYSRRDEEWRVEIDRLLAQFHLDVAVRTWYDGDIAPGTEWAPEIDRNLAAADLILLFVGQAFVDSEYCRTIELPAAMQRHASGEARVIPIILEPTTPDWRGLAFGRLQCLPGNGVPVSTWDDRRRALEEVCQGLVQLVLSEGLRPETRMRWELHLEGDAAAFSLADRDATTLELRRASADPTLRCVGVRPGSIVLTIESAQDAVAWAARAFDSGVLRTLLGREVRKVLRLFGSSMHAVSKTGYAKPASLTSTDRMLLPSRPFTPALIRYMAFDEEDPLRHLDATINYGDTAFEGEELAAEARKLMDFFKTAVCVADDDMYVNLAPNETAKLLSPALSGTRLGMGLLEFDYCLKRLSASLMHPDLDTGRRFWAEVTRCCQELLGMRYMPQEMPALQRVWVLPVKATIYEGKSYESLGRGDLFAPNQGVGDRPFIALLEQRVKALTEREHLVERVGETDQISAICDAVFREIVLPEIQTELDQGENFAELRQIVGATILAVWFKKHFATHPKVAKHINSGRPDLLGVDVIAIPPSCTSASFAGVPQPDVSAARTARSSPTASGVRSSPGYRLAENREYFERYMDIFESGVFYVERDELIEGTGTKRARAYFSGAIDLRHTRGVMHHV